MRKVLIYHHYDQDGYLSAAIVASHFKGQDVKLKYAVGNYKEVLPVEEMRWADIIYLLDYSLSREATEDFLEKLVWIDHHQSSMKQLAYLNPPGVREIGKSGCLLTWEYLHGVETVPRVVELVNDRDVWNWQLGEDTAAFHEATLSFLKDYDKWIELLGSNFLTYREVLRGYVILDHARMLVDGYNNDFSWSGKFEGYPVMFVNGSSQISGELHKRLREQNPDAEFAFLFTVIKDKVMVGLYRKDGSTVDMSVIAKAYGGGGHAASAGFYFPLGSLEMLLGGGDGRL
jgi:uncharacterized protein